MQFPNPHRDLGRVKVGTKHILIYTFSNNITVSRIDTSCGCAIVSDTLNTVNSKHEIQIEFKAKPIQPHLVKEGKTSSPTAQQITVFFESLEHIGTPQQETLTFKAVVHQ